MNLLLKRKGLFNRINSFVASNTNTELYDLILVGVLLLYTPSVWFYADSILRPQSIFLSALSRPVFTALATLCAIFLAYPILLSAIIVIHFFRRTKKASKVQVQTARRQNAAILF
jgi:hypothetical protein